jgi:hypothetical protein
MPLSAIFQLYHGDQYIQVVTFIGGNRVLYPVKTTDLAQITDKLGHIMFYQVDLTMGWNQTHNFSGDRH